MKFLKIIILVFILILTDSCHQDDFEINETIEGLESKSDGNLNQKNISPVVILEDMLHFSSKAEISQYYQTLKQLELNHINSTITDSVYVDVIKQYNKQIGFHSLRDLYNDLELQDINWMDGDRSYIGLPILQNILSSKKEVAIDNKIFKYVESSKIAVIENLNLAALYDVRNNGAHSFHPDVSYFDRYTDDVVKHIGPSDDGPGPNQGCSFSFSVVHETFYGNDSNKLRINGRMRNLSSNCHNALKYTIDWGDGNITNSLNGTHTYQVPQFSNNECATFTVTVTAEWKYACGGCPKGKKSVRTIEVELCPVPDLCVKGQRINRTSQIFYPAINGPKYKLVGEIGVEKCGWILDFYHAAYAVTYLYKTTGNPVQNNYIKAVPTQHVGVDLYGQVFSNDQCDNTHLALSNPKEINNHSVERRTFWNINPIYTHQTGEDQIFADFWVDTQNELIKIEKFGLWD